VQDDGDDAAAVSWYRRALELDRALVESWGNLGTALYSLGQIEEAERCWSKCVAFDAKSPSASLAQAYVWLRRGDYARGWSALNHRWLDETFTSTYGRPDLKGVPWTGQPLRARDRILIHGEQGLGDHVMFARYIPELIERGYPIAGLETRGPLKRWMEACLPEVPVYVRDADELPHYTHHVPLMSLPGVLGLREPVAPLRPMPTPRDGDNVAGLEEPPCAELLESSLIVGAVDPAQPPRPLRVGIVWRGTTGNVADFERSIPVEALAVLADTPGVTWVPLQFDPSGDSDTAAALWLETNVEPLTERYQDVLGLAEVMLGLDLVVTVDTLAAHVAGSIGVQAMILHRFNREWRWQSGHRGEDSERCNWYPTVTHLTQPAPRDWRGLLRTVRERVQSLNGQGLALSR
jgi:hypothetical protein